MNIERLTQLLDERCDLVKFQSQVTNEIDHLMVDDLFDVHEVTIPDCLRTSINMTIRGLVSNALVEIDRQLRTKGIVP